MVENKLNLRIDKCKFLFNELEYLGYFIMSKGINSTNSAIDAVSKFPVSQSIRNIG